MGGKKRTFIVLSLTISLLIAGATPAYGAKKINIGVKQPTPQDVKPGQAPSQQPQQKETSIPTPVPTPAPVYKKVIIYVFEDSRNLYQIGIMGLKGEDKKILTKEGNNWCPCVSPDGAKIAFFSDRSGFTNLWIMDSDSRNIRQMTFNRENINSIDLQNRGMIEWSKDGELVYFIKSGDLWQIDKDGETPSAKTELHDVTSFKLSPDKLKVVLSREKTKRHNGLWSLNMDGTNSRQITPSIIVNPAFDWGDNMYLAYFHNRGISSVEYTGVNRKFLKETYYLDNSIEWSKSGTDRNTNLIAYISDKNQGPNIWIMKADGSDERQVTQNGAFSPSWFPDGKTLLFVEGADIFKTDINTRDKIRLTYNFSAYYPFVADIKITAEEAK